MKKIAIIMALALAWPLAQAEDRFVTDQFKITMRSGQSPTHKIMRMLPSGYQLKLIRNFKDTGYSEVQTKDGKRGYVLTRQLISIPSARDRLAAAEKRLAELQTEPERLSAKLVALRTTHDELSNAHTSLQKEKQGIEAELKSIKRTAGNALRISAERNELRKQVGVLTHQVEDFKTREPGTHQRKRPTLVHDRRWSISGRYRVGIDHSQLTSQTPQELLGCVVKL